MSQNVICFFFHHKFVAGFCGCQVNFFYFYSSLICTINCSQESKVYFESLLLKSSEIASIGVEKPIHGASWIETSRAAERLRICETRRRIVVHVLATTVAVSNCHLGGRRMCCTPPRDMKGLRHCVTSTRRTFTCLRGRRNMPFCWEIEAFGG